MKYHSAPWWIATIPAETPKCTTVDTIIGLLTQFRWAARNVLLACFMVRDTLKEHHWGKSAVNLANSDDGTWDPGPTVKWKWPQAWRWLQTGCWLTGQPRISLCYWKAAGVSATRPQPLSSSSHISRKVSVFPNWTPGETFSQKFCINSSSLYFLSVRPLHTSLAEMAHRQEREGTLACIVLPWFWEIL